MKNIRAGFTLLEVLFTVLILAVLAAVAVPLYQSTLVSSQTSVCKTNIQSIANAESKFRFDTGGYKAGATVAALSTSTAAEIAAGVPSGLISEGLANIPVCPAGGGYSVVSPSATAGYTIDISCSSTGHGGNTFPMH